MELHVIEEKKGWRPLSFSLIRHSYPGTLVAFDGIDGSGKTTCVARLARIVEASGCTTLVARLPTTGVRNHPAWRAWHSDLNARKSIDEFGLTLMSLGDRLVHQSMVVEAALSEGKVVLCDRYVLSILAYWSTSIHRKVCSRFISPDVAILCDVPVRVAFNRCRVRRNEPSHLHDIRLLGLLDGRYKRLYRAFRYARISTDQSLESTDRDLVALLAAQQRTRERRKRGSRRT